MATQPTLIVPLCELVDGQEADFFVLMTAKEELTTREGKPYYRVGFRDAGREVSFPIWGDSSLAEECRSEWEPGAFYKVRGMYRVTNYGPQLDIRRLRPVTEADQADGFDPWMCQPCSRFDPETMFAELVALAEEQIEQPRLLALVLEILHAHRETLLSLPAATHNHHAYIAGFLEHVLSVTRTCVYLVEKYRNYYPQMQPPLSPGMAVAGAILHDIGKLRELQQQPQGAVYTPAGELIGHILQGRDLVREFAAGHDLDEETLLRLEHIIVSHQRLPEWGSPKPPMTPEALLVHTADDLDAKFHMMVMVLAEDRRPGPVTSAKNALRQKVFRGLEP